MVWLYAHVNNYRMDLDNIGNIVTDNDQPPNLETRENSAISNITSNILNQIM